MGSPQVPPTSSYERGAGAERRSRGSPSHNTEDAYGSWAVHGDRVQLKGCRYASREDFKHAPDGNVVSSKGSFQKTFPRATLESQEGWAPDETPARDTVVPPK